jgi:acyl-CoA synthetase (AMP-forming)/AMP-acid ligase II
LQDVLTYAVIKKKSQAIAGRLLSLGLEPGARVALIADTDPDFIIFFFACQYAGMGAEMIRKEPLEQFASLLSSSGFKPDAMTACYGMAECSLAVCFAPLGQGIKIDCVDSELLSEQKFPYRVKTERSWQFY